MFGPRQTGKSTLLKATFGQDESLYYDLLVSDEFRRLAARPSLLRDEVLARPAKRTHVIVDEIQRVPDLLSEIHSLLESPNAPIFCMSGSSARKLKRQQADLLAGRAWTLSLHPLTHGECGPLFSLDRVLRLGSLPSVHLDDDEEGAKRTLKAYAGTYLKEEIEAEALVRRTGSFLRFLPLAAAENGNFLNYSAIARETGTSYQSVKGYFQILEDTLLGFMLSPYSKSARTTLAKRPRFYFFDLGVQRALAGRLSAPLERGTPDYGRAFEHFLILEVLRLADYAGKDYALSAYRTEGGAEVDLVVETPERGVFAIEVKVSDDPHPADLRGLRSFAEAVPGARLLCACLAPRRRTLAGIHILPWQELFAEIGL